jgi:hypothetical protein
MIKFNNFPPNQAGDVELLPVALTDIIQNTESANAWDDGAKAVLNTYGAALAQLLFHSVADRADIESIVQPVFDAITEHAGNAGGVEVGFKYGWEDELKGVTV